MRFPAYGKNLWDRRLLGERPRVVLLLVGNRWKIPNQFAGDVTMVLSPGKLTWVRSGTAVSVALVRSKVAWPRDARGLIRATG